MPPIPSAPRRPFVTALKVMLYGGLLGLLALIVAVAVAVASLPSYNELRRSEQGQTIRIRSSSGAVLVSLGPSYGLWLPYEKIPPQMRAAMIAVEDKRFRGHIGVDPVGMARSIKIRLQVGRWTQGGSTAPASTAISPSICSTSGCSSRPRASFPTGSPRARCTLPPPPLPRRSRRASA